MRLRSLLLISALVAAPLASLPLTGAVAAATPDFPSEQAKSTLQAYGGLVSAGEQIGNRIYVGGTFTSVGYGSGTIARSYLVAFDATTGQLDPGFNPVPTGRVDSLLASADGRSLYVGGIWTSIGGCTACRGLAKVDAATGAADLTFHPKPNSSPMRMALSGNRLYLGGWFTKVNGVPRGYVAAVDATTGALDPSFVVNADGKVRGMNISPDGRYLYLAGMFSTVGGQPRTRFASIDTQANAVTGWDPGAIVISDGWDVTTSPDGQTAYLATANGTQGWASGYHESIVKVPAVFNGTPAVQWAQGWAPLGAWNTGDVNALVATDTVVFAGGHLDTIEDASGKRKHLLAMDVASGGVLPWNPFVGGARGILYMKMLPAGLFFGGDFPTVNKAPHSLFAILPRGADTSAPSLPVPTVTADAVGSLTVRWPASLDTNDINLNYTITRDGTPVGTLAAAGTPFIRPMLTFVDSGLTPGASHAYRVSVTDGVNNVTSRATASTQVAATTPKVSYANTVLAAAPSHYWRLGKPVLGASQDETAAGRGGIYTRSGVTYGATGSLPADADPAITLDGVTGAVRSAAMAYNPTTFSTELRFRTTTTRGGRLIGFGNRPEATSSRYDRHVYMTNTGQLVFGAFNGGIKTITSSAAYNDGQWHSVVATMGATGMVLYVDGTAVGTNPNAAGEIYWGFWKVGADNLAGWPARPTSNAFAGSVDEVAIYPTALTASQVAAHAAAAR